MSFLLDSDSESGSRLPFKWLSPWFHHGFLARKQKSQLLGNKAGILFFSFIHNTVSVDTHPTLNFSTWNTDRTASVSAKKRRSLLLGQLISRFPQRFPRRRLPPARRGGRHRMNHQGLFALARGATRGEWDFHSPTFPLVCFPGRLRPGEHGAGRGRMR